jgi:hypothetical protein
MPEGYDRHTMERLHQHLARADVELRDAQHFLNAGSTEEAEMDLVHDVAAARLAVTSALERVRPRLGVPSPSEATSQPGRVGSQLSVESAQEPRESPEMHMPEAGGGPLPHDQQRPSERRSWWRRMFEV